MQPTMPPVEVQALPASLLPHISPRLALTGPAWESAKQETLAASSFRCELTGAPVAAAREHWAVDDSQRVLRLLGLRAEAPEVSVYCAWAGGRTDGRQVGGGRVGRV